MNRRGKKWEPEYTMMPDNLVKLHNNGASNIFAPPQFPGFENAVSYMAKPWPSAQRPAQGLGYLPPYDREFAVRNGAASADIGWQRTELNSHPWWNRPDVIAANKEMEYRAAFGPQSRRHELAHFHSALVSQPPQSTFDFPESVW